MTTVIETSEYEPDLVVGITGEGKIIHVAMGSAHLRLDHETARKLAHVMIGMTNTSSGAKPKEAAQREVIDWYERRDEMLPGQVFRTRCGSVVRLDHRVPGDGTDWSCDVWYPGWPDKPGYEHGRWVCDEARHHPGDFTEKLPDDWKGD